MRWLGRAAVVVGTVLAVLPVGPAAALADDDEVRLEMPKGVTVGGAREEVTIEVRRREDGCVSVSFLLVVDLPGAADGQLQAAVRDDGQWRQLRVSHVGNGRFVAEPVAPDDPRVCKDDHSRASVLLQVGLVAGAPGGDVRFAAEVYTETGDLVGRTDEALKVSGGRSPSPSPSVTPSPSVAASRSPTPAGPAVASRPASAGPAQVAPTGGTAGQSEVVSIVPAASDSGVFGSAGRLVMALGLALVGVGVWLLVVLVRRNRRDSGGTDPPGTALSRTAR